MNSRLRLFLPILIAALILVFGLSPLAQAEGEPAPGTVAGITTYQVHSAALTGSGTSYSTSGATSSVNDSARSRFYNSADIFVTADFSTTGTITVTLQHSIDRTNWADAWYSYVAGSNLVTANYRVVVTNDGTGYVSLPMRGEYLRAKIERTGSVTPTISFTYRNN